jgi:hypothetical protein
MASKLDTGRKVAEVSVRDVVYLTIKQPVARHDCMTVEDISSTGVNCVWIDESLNLQRKVFMMRDLTNCDLERTPPPPRSRVRPGSTVGLPSAGLNNGMVVESIDGDLASCAWDNARGLRCREGFSIGVLELLLD